MADSDYVVMALPYTESTHHLVNAEAVQSMRPNGVLINVGRGKTLEQDAVVKGTPHILGFTLTSTSMIHFCQCPQSLRRRLSWHNTLSSGVDDRQLVSVAASSRSASGEEYKGCCIGRLRDRTPPQGQSPVRTRQLLAEPALR